MERNTDVRDLTGWTPRTDGGDTMSSLGPNPSYFVVTEHNTNGDHLHTIILADRDRLRIFHGGWAVAKDIIGSVEIGRMPPDERAVKRAAKIDIDWISLEAVLHRSLSGKLNIEHLNETAGVVFTDVNLDDAVAAQRVVEHLIDDWVWQSHTVTSPPTLRWRDVRNNVWIPVAFGVIAWRYGDRVVSGEFGAVALGVGVAFVLSLGLLLMMGRKTTRLRVVPGNPPYRRSAS